MEHNVHQQLLAESWENLSQLEAELVPLLKEPNDSARLESVFRSIQAVNGACGVFDSNGPGTLPHAMENVLRRMHDGRLPVLPAAISLVLEGIGEIKSLLECLEATGQKSARNNDILVSMLNELAASPPAGDGSSPEMDTLSPAQGGASPADAGQCRPTPRRLRRAG